jgi:uncharacterized membrane protein YjjP (DUF1212 family)
MPDLPSPGGVSRFRFGAAVVVALAVAAVLLLRRDPVDPALAALYALFAGYLFVSSIDRVRSHPLFDAASAASTALLFTLLSVADDGGSLVPVAIAAVAWPAVAVVLCNYRHGTAYLRIER